MSALQALVAHDLAKTYGDHVVLDGFDLVANPGQPLGLIGANGIGKSTVLRLLAGVELPDAGVVSRPADVGYLPQNPGLDTAGTVQDTVDDALAPLHAAVRRLELLAAGLDEREESHRSASHVVSEYERALSWAEHHAAWDADRRAELALTRLGLADLGTDRPVATLSGGERSRLALALLVTRRPECVLLDEPTNHLDDAALQLVEQFLLELPGVAVVASHDRLLLDRVCAVVVDLDPSHFGVDGLGGGRYAGGFTAYLGHQRRARERWDVAYRDQQCELDRLHCAVRTTARQVAHDRLPRDADKSIYAFKGGNVQAAIRRRVRNAENRIATLQRIPVPKPPEPLAFSPPGPVGSDSASIHVHGLRVEGRVTVTELHVAAGEHLLVTGANGSGKSTLLSALAGRVRASAGTVEVSARRIGLLPQDVRFRRPAMTASQLYAALTYSDAPRLRDLGLLLPEDLARPVGHLSVGQQRRLALAVIVAMRPDLLLLDEPTNHISLALAAELESAMAGSGATVVVASHDRWLRQRWAGSTYQL